MSQECPAEHKTEQKKCAGKAVHCEGTVRRVRQRHQPCGVRHFRGCIDTAVRYCTGFIYLGSPNHTFSHLISDLMLTLIIMALLRQAIQLIKNQPFTLLPFVSIGLIASVRGFLIAQIKVGLGEIDWAAGLIQLGAYAIMTIAMATCFYVFSRGTEEREGV